METTDILTTIRESFELWYNKNIGGDSPVTIAANYSDTQTLAIKAYHRVCAELQAVGVRDGKSFVQPLIKIEENYNHGVTSEQDAKDMVMRKLLVELYGYRD